MSADRRIDLLIESFRAHFYLPDPTSLYVALACVAANRVRGVPLWIMLVGPPGSGKTAILSLFDELEDVYPTAEVTVSGLLSGVAARDRTADAKGGLLLEMGEFGIILAKDFGTVMNMHAEGRQQVLAALREISDGRYTRRLGSDGGTSFDWRGKVGFLGACTPVIDRHSAVMNLMGERFLICRMRSLCESDEDELMRCARESAGGLSCAEAGLRHDVGESLRSVRGSCADMILPAPGVRAVHALASLIARCRSAVERDGRSREILLVPEPEVPTRIVTQLDRLWVGLRLIGLDSGEAWRIVRKVGLDSMPALKRDVLGALMSAPTAWTSLTDVRGQVSQPEQTVRRALQDLEAHGVLQRRRGNNNRDEWSLNEWAVRRVSKVSGFPGLSGDLGGPRDFPEMSDHLQ